MIRRSNLSIRVQNVKGGDQAIPAAVYAEAIKKITPLLEKEATGGKHEIRYNHGSSSDAEYRDYTVTWSIRETRHQQ